MGDKYRSKGSDVASTSRGKVFRTTVDCRAIHGPIHFRDSNLRNIIEIDQEVLPIIFIPGIMGSRLCNSDGVKVWDPDSKIFMLGKYGLRWQDAAKKKEMLVGSAFDPNFLSVIEQDARHNKIFFDSEDKTRSARGWGGIAWNSYGQFLTALQCKQWESSVRFRYQMPVHAFGYNWTGCNSLAAKKLGHYIQRTIDSYNHRKCEAVILVTHSMGGLVARAAIKLPGVQEKVLGIIHGVQPAMGSAAAYWRMKGGFERPHTIPELDAWQWLKNPAKALNHMTRTFLTKGIDFGMGTDLGLGNMTCWVLGTDGEEVTSLLGNMPGGLELLPNRSYRDNDGKKSWLVLVDPDGRKTRLPKSDVYEEIYRERHKFYRLVNPEWLDPGASEESSLRENVSCWEKYLSYLALAEQFHKKLKTGVHCDTYQFYSTGIASADRVVFARTMDTWAAKGKRMLDVVKNEWIGKAQSTVVDKAKEKLLKPVTEPVEKALFGNLPWTDIVLHPREIVDTVRAMPRALTQVPTLVRGSFETYPGAITMARTLGGAIGKGVVVAAAMNAVGVVVRDSAWYINRGGYRDKVNGSEMPYHPQIEALKEDILLNEGNCPNPPPAEAVYVITMNTPDGAGDGTVPELSARALHPVAAAKTKRDKKGKIIPRTFIIGDKLGDEADYSKKNAPRTRPQMKPDFHEAWFDRGHEPVFKSKSAQLITFTAIENICRRRIADHKATGTSKR